MCQKVKRGVARLGGNFRSFWQRSEHRKNDLFFAILFFDKKSPQGPQREQNGGLGSQNASPMEPFWAFSRLGDIVIFATPLKRKPCFWGLGRSQNWSKTDVFFEGLPGGWCLRSQTPKKKENAYFSRFWVCFGLPFGSMFGNISHFLRVWICTNSVSYTHLTLPTICSV